MKTPVSAAAAITLETIAMFFLCILAPISIGLFAAGFMIDPGRDVGSPPTQLAAIAAVVAVVSWIVGAVMLIIAKIFSSILLYRLWSSVPSDYRSISPGRAVGFCFVPIFCFYWFFVAYPGLVSETSKVTGTRGPYGLAIAYAVLLCATPLFAWHIMLIPIILLSQYVIWLLMTIKMTRHANTVLLAPSGPRGV